MNNVLFPSRLGQRVMRRVYLIWFFRYLVFSPWPRLAVLGLVYGWLSFFISPGQILENMRSVGGWSGYFGLFISAVASTERLSLILLALIFSLAGWLLVDLSAFLGRRVAHPTMSRPSRP